MRREAFSVRPPIVAWRMSWSKPLTIIIDLPPRHGGEEEARDSRPARVRYLQPPLEGRWIHVPDDAVITEPNRAGRTVVWPYMAVGGADSPILKIRCFMPGSMG